MILENELRIGNYVYGGLGEIIKVELDDLCYDVRQRFKPIELTEEILLKCGFLNWNGYYSKGDIKYEKENIILNFWSDDSYVIKGIKHLHQLQNLYFALTGDELNIEL